MAKLAVFGQGKWELLRWDGAVWSTRQVKIGSDGVISSADGGPHFELAGEACTVIRPGLMLLAADDLVMRTETDFHAMRKRVSLHQLFSSSGDLMELVKNGVTFAWAILAVVLLVLVASTHSDVSSVMEYLKIIANGMHK